MKKKMGTKYLCLILALVLTCTVFNVNLTHTLNASASSTILDDFTSLTGWSNFYNSTITQNDPTTAKISCGSGGSYGTQQKTFTNYNVDTYPTFTIDITQLSSGASWSLKVNNGGTDICLQGTSTATGVLSFDLKRITGWSGNQSALNVKLFPMGGNGKYFIIDSIGNDTTESTILDDFTSVDDWTNFYNSTITQNDATTAKVTCGSTDSYGTPQRAFTYNVDTYPMINIDITQVSSGACWSLKVNNGGSDICIQGDSTGTGVLSFDLKRITGWSGNQTINIKPFVTGGSSKYYIMDYVSIGTAESNVLDDFSSVDDWSNFYNSSITQYDSTTAKITCLSGNTYGTQRRAFTYNVSNNPMLNIKVTQVGSGSQWALKVNNGSGDIVIQNNSSSTGTFTYDLANLTGWSGNQTFNVELFPIGGNGAYCLVDYLSIVTGTPQNHAYWSIRGTNYYPRDYPWGSGVMWTSACANSIFDADCLTMKNLGINTVRVFVTVNGNLTYYNADWSATTATTDKIGAFLTSCNNNGIKAIICLDAGQSNIDNGTIASNNYVKAKNFYYSLINTFKNDSRILAWDEINEPDADPDPNQSWSSNMAAYVSTMFSYMKTLTTQPITIGLAWRGDELKSIGVTPDIFQYHEYSGGTTAQIQTTLQNYKTQWPSTPILVGEFGIDTCNNSEAQQNQIYKNVLDAVNNVGGIYGTCNWCLWDFPSVSGSEGAFGILRADGTTKPAVNTLSWYY